LVGQFEIAAHGLTAILATWLGLTVAVRARRLPAARVFGFLSLFLVTWSVAIIVQRFAPSDALTVRRIGNAFEDLGAFLVIAATPHIALSISVERTWNRLERFAIYGGYLVAVLMALPAAVNPAAKLNITPPHFELPGIPGAVFGWTWIAVRMAMFALAFAWIVLALRRANGDRARSRQLQVALLTVALGGIGGILRFTPPFSDTDPWLGVSIVTLSVVVAAYAVFAQHLFFSADIAARTFRYSLVGGLVVTAYVGVVLGLDRVVRDVLSIEVPIVTALALVATIALFEPISDRLRHWMSSRTRRDVAYERLLRALGEPLLLSASGDRPLEPALARLTRLFRLTGASLIDVPPQYQASHGSYDESSPLALRLPLASHGRTYGTILFGPKRSGLPYATSEVEVLRLAAEYLAGSIGLAESESEQAVALDRLSGQRQAIASTASELQAALASHPASTAALPLSVFALGPLRVERRGQLLMHWGGAKAGTRQAEAVFAFLFDRGERGASKDEIVELIWPDVDLERADLAFHRTLGGLRTTLEPARRGGNRGTAITFHNDRYRLDSALIAWSDVTAFEDEMAAATGSADEELATRHLERARSLYRGDYLDDCPFYGDSAQVEERRELVRGRFVDLLLALGERYEARGDRPAAASCLRQARQVNGESPGPADEALNRVGVAT
jgi:hypothetical protein